MTLSIAKTLSLSMQRRHLKHLAKTRKQRKEDMRRRRRKKVAAPVTSLLRSSFLAYT